MGSKMKGEDYIEKFGILLDDVLISRKKALKKGDIEITNEYVCPKCGNTDLEVFYASNSAKCWKDLCGVGGECIFCNRCMDIVKFYKTEMS
jgi:hypothetical protein